MSITLEKPAEATPTQYPLTLTDRFPNRAKVAWPTMTLVGVLGGLFAWLSFRPLSHTDVFGHLAYGELIWTQRSLPVTEPFLPLSAGMPFIDTAWLTQLIGYGVFQAWGYVGLQFAVAALTTWCFALLANRLYHRTQHLGLTLLGLAAMAILAWIPLSVARPQLAGYACYMTILYALTARRWNWTQWVAIPLSFALWANLHGSFLMGLFALVLLTAGRGWDVFRATGEFHASVSDGPFRRLFLVTELAVAATLINPYGLRLYTDVLFFAEHPNLSDLIEWQPLDFRSTPGLLTVGLAFGLACVYRKTPRRVPTGEVLLVTGLLFATLWSQRMLVWWAPVAAGALVWNLHAIFVQARGERYALPPGHSRWSVVTLGLLWISFAYTPFGLLLIHHKPTDMKRTLSKATPIAAVEYLKKTPPRGLVFNTYEWGDYLVWAGPKDLQVFVDSHVHLVPREVWRHYLQLSGGSTEFKSILDRYGINTVVIDNYERRQLVSRLKDAPDWEKVYSDSLATIYRRKKAI